MTTTKVPRWLRIDAVLAMHQLLIAEHGGLAGVRDEGLLASALARPTNAFTYEDTKPTLPALAAVYGYGLAKNHPFNDGNKRTALTAAAVFLEINGWTLTATEAEAAVMFERLAAGKVPERALGAWFTEHSKKLR